MSIILQKKWHCLSPNNSWAASQILGLGDGQDKRRTLESRR